MTTPASAVAGNAEAAQREAAARERRPAAAGGGKDLFTRKYGPLPGWGWAVVAGGAALIYFYWRSRQKAQAATASTTGSAASYGVTSTTGYDTAASQAALQAEIEQLQGALSRTGTATAVTKTTTASTTTAKTAAPAQAANPATITVPNEIGQSANFAIGELTTNGLNWRNGGADRNPANCYQVATQSPPAGTKVAQGTVVTITYKQVPCA